MRAVLTISAILAIGVPPALATFDDDVTCSIDDRNLRLKAYFYWGTEGMAEPEGQMELRAPSLPAALRRVESLTPGGKRLWRLRQNWRFGDDFKAQIVVEIGEADPHSIDLVIDARRSRSSEYTGRYVLTTRLSSGGTPLTSRGSVRCTVKAG
jgi:hypothetical protein